MFVFFERNVEMERNIPNIKMPVVSQKSFEYAADILRRCTVDHSIDGGNHPFVAPGGAYGACMWSLDAALAVSGYKWLNNEIGGDLLTNIIGLSMSDGRVKLYTPDSFGHIPNVCEKIGSLPKFFEEIYEVVKRSGNPELIQKAYGLFAKNLSWWFSHRQDPGTKLITAVFEETFVPHTAGRSMEYAPMDTNIEIAVGCNYTGLLAEKLGLQKEAAFYFDKKEEILTAVDQYLWNPVRGAYYGYLINEKRSDDRLMASTFYGLRFDHAPSERKEALLNLLTDNSCFNWDTYPLTSVSKKDGTFALVEGRYTGNPSWSGSIWTLINDAVVRALNDSNQKRLAAELTYKTIRIFKDNYAEFLHPYNGSGHGVSDYAWTASLFIRLIIEEIFGIDYNGFTKEITIRPNLPAVWKNSSLSIEHLVLPNGKQLRVDITAGAVTYLYEGDDMKIVV